MKTIILIATGLILTFSVFGQTPTLKKFSKTPCIENCKKWDTVYLKKHSDNVLTINFGRRESCDDSDTALVRIKGDTIRIVIGEKKLLHTRIDGGKTIHSFEPGPEEECDCFYDYFIEVMNLETSPQSIIIDRRIYLEGIGFRPYKSRW